jgi:hypothetical protein
MQLKWSTILCICLFALSAIAEPGNGSRQGAGGGSGRPGDRNDPRGAGRGGPMDFNSAEMKKFKDEFRAFCLENSPARYAEFERQATKSKNDNEFRSRVLSRLVFGFKWYQDLKKNDRALYDIKTEQLKIEDKEFALLLAKKHLDDAERNPPAYLKAAKPLTPDEIATQLKIEGKAFVEARLKEREHRIKRLEDLIAKEKANLVADQNNKGKLVDEHLEQLEKEGLEPKGPPRRPEGEGAQRPTEPNNLTSTTTR